MGDDVQDLKPTPENADAEKAVLSCLLQDNDTLDRIAGIDERAFHNKSRRRLYRLMRTMIEAGDVVDQVTLLEGLQGVKALGDEGAGMIAELASDPALTANAERYAEILAEAAERRRLINLSEQLAEAANDTSQDPADVAAWVSEQVEAVGLRGFPMFGRLSNAKEVEAWRRDWLIPGWLPGNTVTLFAGPGGVGKSRMALQLAAALALGYEGMPWQDGERLNGQDGRRVVYASYEDETTESEKRLLQGGRRMGWMRYSDLYASDRLRLVDLQGQGPIWSIPPAKAQGTETPAGRWLKRQSAQWGAGLLIIDNAAAAFGGNENARAEVRQFVGDLDAWARREKCAVLILGHPPKYSDAPYSGSTDWQAAARMLWSLKEENTGGHSLQVVKSNYAPAPAKAHLKQEDGAWVRVDTEGGEDGEETAGYESLPV